MEIEIIDFDKKFEEYIKQWLDENESRFSGMDEIETGMPNLYAKWINTQFDWLSNKMPSEYFVNYSADELIYILSEYILRNIGIPDLLFDSLVAKKADVLAPLGDILFGRVEIKPGIEKNEIKTIVLNLINEIAPSKYIKDYIAEITKPETDKVIAEIMTETIKEYASSYIEELVVSLKTSASEAVRLRLLDILVNYPQNKAVFDILIDTFISTDYKALAAAYLGKYGNPEACTTLKKALDWTGINYLDYQEIRNSIEELGETVNHWRDFEGDEYYEAMKGLKNEE